MLAGGWADCSNCASQAGKACSGAIRQFRWREHADCAESARMAGKTAGSQFGSSDGGNRGLHAIGATDGCRLGCNSAARMAGVRLASLYVLQSTCTQQQPLMRLQGTLVTTVEGKCVHLRHRPAFHAPARHTRRAGGLQNISLTRSGRIVNLQSTSTPYPVPGRSAICQFCGPSASPRREYHSTATLIRLSSPSQAHPKYRIRPPRGSPAHCSLRRRSA